VPQSRANVENFAPSPARLGAIDRDSYRLSFRRHIDVSSCVKETKRTPRLNNHGTALDLTNEYLDNLLLRVGVLRKRNLAKYKIRMELMRKPPRTIVGP
jgi:hypothetical protein